MQLNNYLLNFSQQSNKSYNQMSQFNIKQSIFALTLLTISAFLLASIPSTNQTSEFDEWKANHHIHYQSEFQNNFRRKIFEQNKVKMIQHNENPSNTYMMGLNQFSAMTQEEFKKQFLMDIQVERKVGAEIEVNEGSNAADVDWTQQGAVGPVKNQGQCAAAWTFSTTGPLQGLAKISTGTLTIFSDQQLIDCANPGSSSCSSGYPLLGFRYVKQHGICTAEEYPFHGVQQTCKIAQGSFKISSFIEISSCTDLSNAIHKGPVSVLVDATNWYTYASGVFSNCGNSLNHAVTLVGQVQDNWRVQNSWGTMWGEKGFIRLAKGNTCGVCMNGVLPYK